MTAGCGHWVEKPIEQDQFSLYWRDPKISTLPKNFSKFYGSLHCRSLVCHYVGILRFHNILSLTIMSPLCFWACYNAHFSPFCNHYLLNLLRKFWFFSLSHQVSLSYCIVITENVEKGKYIQRFVSARL